MAKIAKRYWKEGLLLTASADEWATSDQNGIKDTCKNTTHIYNVSDTDLKRNEKKKVGLAQTFFRVPFHRIVMIKSFRERGTM